MTIKQNINIGANVGQQGLGAYAAASSAIEGGLPGGTSVGQWLPFVGLGLSAYNLAENPSQQGAWYTALSAFSLIPGAAPFALAMGAIAGGIGYAKSQSAKHAKRYIQWHTPKLEVIGQDEEGWTYLYDTNFEFHEGGWVGEELPPSAQARHPGFILRYNPETNELQQTDMAYQSSFSRHHFHHMTPEQATTWIAGEDPGLTSQNYRQIKGSRAAIRKGRNACTDSGGRISEQHKAGGANNYYCVTDHAVSPGTKKYPQVDWRTIDLTHNWYAGGKLDPVITDPSAFQSEIYNNVLLPQGYVDAPSAETGWSTVTMSGQEYFMDSSGLLADMETGYLLGAADPETGQVIDFSGPKGKSRVRKSSGDIQPGSITYLGTIDNWVEIKPTFNTDDSPAPITEIPTVDMPVADIKLPGQSPGLLSTSGASGQGQSPFATPGTWDPTVVTGQPAAATAPPQTEDTPSPADGGLLSQTASPVADITLPQRSLKSSPGLLSGDQQQQGQSPFSVPGTWDPTATLVKPVVPVPPGTQR